VHQLWVVAVVVTVVCSNHIEFWQWFSLLLNASKEVFFGIELCLEPFKVEEDLVF
jgi:hypothetical protein